MAFSLAEKVSALCKRCYLLLWVVASYSSAQYYVILAPVYQIDGNHEVSWLRE